MKSKETTGKKRHSLRVAVIIILAVVVVFSVFSFYFVNKNLDESFCRTTPPKYSVYLRYEDVEGEVTRELLSFKSGENTLQGYLYGGADGKGLVVIAHGIGGGAESYFPETMAFLERGYSVFAYDNTGCFNSEGKNSVGLNQSALDLDAALTFLEGEERFAALPVYLYGHSWGGYAVTAVLKFQHNVAAVVSVAGFNKPMQMMAEWTKDSLGFFTYVEYPYIWIVQHLRFGSHAGLNAVDGINSTNTPVLLVHGKGDETIGIDRSGIVAYSDKITNPNVSIKICSVSGQDGHSTLTMSSDAISYLDELDKEYQTLWDKFDGEIPDEELKAFFGTVDRRRTSALDEEFLDTVTAFFDRT